MRDRVIALEGADRYARVRCIGRGSFGRAYLVDDRVTGERCAVKEVDVAGLVDSECEAALNEVAVLRALRHPYIVRYRDAFLAEGRLCLCMEYAPGGDLHARVARQRRLGVLFPQAKVLDWFTQLTMALSYLHERHILHRDLKTQNVFISAREHVKLGDFGISKTLSTAQPQAATIVGTPYYLSPEICLGRPYGAKSDCWAAGCVLYEMLTLQHAFQANSISALAVKIIAGRYPPPPASYDDSVRNLVAALLTLDPNARLSAATTLCLPVLRPHVHKYARGMRPPPAGAPVPPPSREVSPVAEAEAEAEGGNACGNAGNRGQCGDAAANDYGAPVCEPSGWRVGANAGDRGQRPRRLPSRPSRSKVISHAYHTREQDHAVAGPMQHEEPPRSTSPAPVPLNSPARSTPVTSPQPPQPPRSPMGAESAANAAHTAGHGASSTEHRAPSTTQAAHPSAQVAAPTGHEAPSATQGASPSIAPTRPHVPSAAPSALSAAPLAAPPSTVQPMSPAFPLHSPPSVPLPAISRWDVGRANFMLTGARTLPLHGIDAGDGVFSRMEALRVFLEDQLGEPRLQAAHTALETMLLDDSAEVDTKIAPTRTGLQNVRQLLAPASPVFLGLLVQLVHCEAYYFVVAQ